MFKRDLSLFSNTHTVHYRLSSASWHSSNSNHSWNFRFVPGNWQVYHRWSVPAVGSPWLNPDWAVGTDFPPDLNAARCWLPFQEFLRNWHQTRLWFWVWAQPWCTQMLSPATKAEPCVVHFSFPAEPTKQLLQFQPPREDWQAGCDHRSWDLFRKSSDNSRTSLLVEEKWPLGSTQ